MKKILLGLLIGLALTAGIAKAASVFNVQQGGTGVSSVRNGEIMYGSSTNQSLNKLSTSTAGSILISNSSNLPFWLVPGTDGDCLKSSSTATSKLAYGGCGTGGGGLTSLNSQTGATQTFATNTTATGLTQTITSAANSHTWNLSLTSGYNIPLTASTTNWNNFYDTPSTRITAGTGLSWAGNTLSASNAFTGSGINGYATRWTGANALSTGILLDNGTVSGVNATSSTASFNIQGSGVQNPLRVASSSGISLLAVDLFGNISVGTTSTSSAVTLQSIAGKNPLSIASSSGASLLTLTNKGSLAINTTSPGSTFSLKGYSGTNILEVSSSTDESLITLDQDGNFRVGKPLTAANFNSFDILTSTAKNFFLCKDPVPNGGQTCTVATAEYSTTTNPFSGAFYGQGTAVNTASSVPFLYGVYGEADAFTTGTGVVDWMSGLANTTENHPGSVVNTMAGVTVHLINPANATTSTAYGFVTREVTLNGTVGSAYGLYLLDIVGATNNYGVYTNRGYNHFGDVTSFQTPGYSVTKPNNAIGVQGGSGTGMVSIGQISDANSFGCINFSNTACAVANYFIGGNNTDLRINSPSGAIVIASNNAEKMRMDTTGNIGILTASPQQPLHVKGITEFETGGVDSYATSTIFAPGGFPTSFRHVLKTSHSAGTAANNGIQLILSDTSGNPTVNLLTLQGNGTVGINTTTPGNALTVVGSISSSALTSGQCVQAGAGGILTTTGSACGSGGSGNSAWTIGNGLIYNATSTDLVGVGTITPVTTLFVQGKGGTNPFAIASSTGTQLITVNQAGNMGIGTTTPGQALSVQGSTGVRFTGASVNTFFNYDGSNAPIYTFSGAAGNSLTTDHTIGTTLQTRETVSTGSYTFATNKNGGGLGTVYTILNVNGVTNGDIGFGSTTPSATMVIQGQAGNTQDILRVASSSNTTYLNITPSGFVGIGTTTPIGFFHIHQDASSTQSTTLYTASSSVPVLQLGQKPLSSPSANGTYLGINSASNFSGNFISMQSNGTNAFQVDSTGQTTIGNRLNIASNGVRMTSNSTRIESNNGNPTATLFLGSAGEELTIKSGKLGIGTTTPAYLLDVNAGNATTTISIDNTSALKGSCLKLKDADGVGYTYISVNNGVLTASTASCE